MKVKVFRGDTWRRAWVLRDASGKTIDLTGASARVHIRDLSGLKVAEASTVDGRITIDGVNGRIDLVMPADVMNIYPETYVFDLEVTTAGGEVHTFDHSTLIILEDATCDL